MGVLFKKCILFILIIFDVIGCLLCRKFGDRAYDGQFPWHAVLQTQTHKHRFRAACGGSLISKMWVLTAAVCVQRPYLIKDGIINVGLGSIIKDKQEIWIESRLYYTYPGENSDIALIKLVMKVPLSSTIRPISLPSEAMTYHLPGKVCEICSFTKGRGRGSILRHIKVKIESKHDCPKLSFFQRVPFKKKHTHYDCAKSLQRHHRDVCKGNPGNGIFIRNGVETYVIGVITDKPCTKSTGVIAYDSLRHSLKWVSGVISGNVAG